jgi:hypothetical protein
MLLSTGLATFSKAQQTNVSGWLASFNTIKLKAPLSLHFDAQLRSTDEVKQVQAILLRPGLNYHINKQFVASLGYAYIGNRRSIATIDGLAPEHRIWQQLLITHPAGFIPVSHRFRLEQRFISRSFVQDNALKTDGYDYASRIRYFTRGIIPLNGEKGFKKGMFAAVQNEIFVNFGNKRTVNGKFFDQNRAYAAAGYRLKPGLDVEAGYMNQYVSGRQSAFTNNHIIQFAIYTRL